MLNLPGTIVQSPDTEALFETLGEALMASALQAVSTRGVFHLALSGGGTPEPFYIRLVTDPKFRGIPWAATHLWIVDERQVPPDDPRSNIRMIREALADHVPMPAGQVHTMPVLADDPAGEYEAELAEAFNLPTGPLGSDIPRLDFILLGMGDDCHTASLFPESPALGVTHRWIIENDGEQVVPPPRLTMTYPLINHARRIVALVVGEGKRQALRRVAEQHATGRPNPEQIPISGIAPVQGGLSWYLDAAAGE